MAPDDDAPDARPPDDAGTPEEPGAPPADEHAPETAPATAKGAAEGAAEGEQPPAHGTADHGRHIHIPPHEPGFFGTLKAMRQVAGQLGHRRVAAATITVFGLGMGALLLFSGFSFWWTSQPDFCARCHPMQKYVDAWEQGPHKDVTCEKCHLTPGLFGFLGGKIAGLQVVMNYVRGNYEDYSFNAAVNNASCLQCHQAILQQNIHTGGAMDVLVSHKNIIEAGAKCIQCHSTVAHGEAVPVGSQTHPTMQTCLQCHNGKIAPLRCSLCHVNGVQGSPNGTMPSGGVPATLPSSHPSFAPASPIAIPSPGGT